MQIASTAKHQVLTLKHLPPLSTTAARLLEMLSDEDLSLEQLSGVISQDPGISARILGVANSAYFGQTTPIHSVEDAVIRVLGLNMVRSLSFSLAISGSFDTSRCGSFDLEAYWYRALATAALSRLICSHIVMDERPDPDGVYLAGLLFDIGALVLIHLFPESYATVLDKSEEGDRQDLARFEEEIIGISSREAGGWLLDRWHLPPRIVQVVQQSGQDEVVESDLVDTAAAWVSHDVKKGSDPVQGFRAIPSDKIEIIQAEFLRQDDGIRAVANLLAY